MNSKNFITAAKRNQPMIILHELAHAYHFKFSKRLDKKIIKAYRSALAAGTYENVEYSTGDRRRAYALTSKDEYFAELTEAYFGTNDFFPFNRKDLERHDRAGYELMEFAWEK